jgi:hypothetical protein
MEDVNTWFKLNDTKTIQTPALRTELGPVVGAAEG